MSIGIFDLLGLKSVDLLLDGFGVLELECEARELDRMSVAGVLRFFPRGVVEGEGGIGECLLFFFFLFFVIMGSLSSSSSVEVSSSSLSSSSSSSSLGTVSSSEELRLDSSSSSSSGNGSGPLNTSFTT